MTPYERTARQILTRANIQDESGLILALATDAVRAGYELGYGVTQ